jgi:hypothetical protein
VTIPALHRHPAHALVEQGRRNFDDGVAAGKMPTESAEDRRRLGGSERPAFPTSGHGNLRLQPPPTPVPQEVANKIYTFVQLLFLKPDEDRDAFLNLMGAIYAMNWDQPKMAPDFVETVKIATV